MIKVFTLNKNGKIELTKKELEQLLNESYWDGYNKKNYWTYTSPTIMPPYNNITCTTSTGKYTINGSNTTTGSITLEKSEG